MDTYNSFIDRIDDEFASLHLQIKRFESGFYDDLGPFATSNVLWPIMWVVPEDVTFLENSVSSYSIRVYFLDLLEKDDSNERDVLSDQLSIARDFTNWLRLNQNNSFSLLDEPRLVAIKSVIMDYTAGWYCDMNIEVGTEGSDCSIPFGLTSSVPVTCDPVIVNINGSFMGSPASGTIYTLNIENSYGVDYGVLTAINDNLGSVLIGDVEWTQTDGSSQATPYGDSIICDITPCGDATVQNTDATYLDVIAAGGLLILPDIEVTDSDGSTYFQPSVTDVFCIPQVQELFIQFGFLIGDDQTGDLIIDWDNAGTFTSATDDGSSGDITFSINSGAFVTFVDPTVLDVGDTISSNRTITTDLGFSKIKGTYV